MTMLTSFLDHLSTVPGPTPSVTPAANQSPSSGTPVWVTLLVGLAGALLASAGAFAGAWRSSRALRQNTERTLEHERTRLLNERFSTAAELLGHNEAACRLAGVHAMAGLADDWTERRQTCIDVLCAYLRMPYPQGPKDTPADADPNGQANREVRLTVIRTIRDHLLPATPPETAWSGYDLDFTGAVFDGGDFSNASFSGGKVRFTGATFPGGAVSFYGATFSGGAVGFYGATFSGGAVNFRGATFSGGAVNFRGATFSGGAVNFRGATFSGGAVNFRGATFSGGAVNFRGATFSGDVVNFGRAEFSGGEVGFHGAKFSSGEVSFYGTEFSAGEVSFRNSKFSGGEVGFYGAKLSSGEVNFKGAKFSGATVTFHTAQFDGGVVDMRDVATWSRPPSFDDGLLTAPPAGLLLPGQLPKPIP
ncbi:pentapeptide repeat-containing protein [Streptomyces sp. NBC_01443]|uniref:pentapeptide repeat-containing protein n=1 Tax=Streptomyces sp. NBC_01443 TaxID=2903868 RepID=UPI00224EC2A3|nr:pentapeptide repeat-containing protein [Streptomyces sp. NBC_01443]MCX4632742.1 pentapeptide repeat-containing protein [Streptomyces sp. NBC_01443]